MHLTWGKCIQRPLVLAVAAALGMSCAHAAAIVVTDGGDSGSAGTCTLRQALAAANTDQATGSHCAAGAGADVLTFAPSLTNVPITLGGTALLINSEITLAGSGQLINAAGLSRVLQVVGNADLHASSLTLFGGHSANDGGGLFVSNSHVALSDVVVYGCSADQHGGGIHLDTYADATMLSLDNVTVRGNSALHGGGLSVSTDGNGTATVELTELTLGSNSAGGLGGGMYIVSQMGTTSVTLDSAIIYANSVYAAGGGVFVDGSGSSITITDSHIINNHGADGGGLFVRAGTASVANSTIASNVGDYGGGVSVRDHASVSIDHSSIHGNSVAPSRASKYGGFGGGLFAGSGSTVTLSATTVSGNTADHGGGLVVAGNKAYIASAEYNGSNGALMRVVASTISGNRSIWTSGATYAVNGGVLEVINSTLVDNRSDRYGGGVVVRGLASASLVHTTIVGNAAFTNPGDVIGVSDDPGGLVVWPGCTASLSNSVLAENRVFARSGDASVHPGATLLVNFSLLGTGLPSSYDTNGNVFSDAPGLGPLADNGGPTQTMAPQPGSLVLGGGNNALVPTGVTTDQRGAGYPRILNTVADMGAVEGIGDGIFKDGFEI